MKSGSLQLHGKRPWASGVVVEGDDARDAAPHQEIPYTCPAGHQVNVRFADRADVEVPEMWECIAHQSRCPRTRASRNRTAAAKQPAQQHGKPPRTHWDMLLERRTIPELDALLDETLTSLRAGRART